MVEVEETRETRVPFGSLGEVQGGGEGGEEESAG